MLQQVVETPERALDDPAHGHLVMGALAERLHRHRVHVVRDEAAVRAGAVADALLEHAAQHGLEAVRIPAVVVAVALDEAVDAHLAAGDVADGVDEVQVWQLAVDAVVDDLQSREPLLQREVERQCALKGARLERQRRDVLGVVRIVVGVYPGLCSCSAVGREENNDVLGPEGPA